MVLYGILDLGDAGGYISTTSCLENCFRFFFKIFNTSFFPSFPQLMVLCGILDQTVPVCRTVPGMHIWQPNVLNYWAESLFPICSLQAVMCFYKYYSWTLFTVGLMLFPLWGKNLHVLGHPVPFFIVFSAMSFLYGFSFGCSSIKVHGGIFHNQLFWNSALDLFSQFCITGCRVLFHQVLILDTSYSGP